MIYIFLLDIHPFLNHSFIGYRLQFYIQLYLYSNWWDALINQSIKLQFHNPNIYICPSF